MTPDLYILNDKHEPVVCPDVRTWARWFETANRRVAVDSFGPITVSTVFLGLDHNFGSGAPILFETMVFGGPLDGKEDRYATYSEAVAGHARMVRRVRKDNA